MSAGNRTASIGTTPGRWPSDGVAAGFAALIAFAIPAIAYTNLLLYHFYVKGSFLLDAGWLAFVASRGGLALANPQAMPDAIGSSYFAVHIAPLFILTSLIRPLLPVSDSQFFAGFLGVSHALLGTGVFWVLYSGFGLRRGLALAAAVLIAIAFSFNGLALAIIRYPHPEILIASAIILCLVALIRRHLVVAALCAVVALASREDAGFHLFGFLFVFVAVNRWHGVPWRAQRAEILLAAIAFLCSAIAVGVPVFLGKSPETFRRIYLGPAPLARFTMETIGLRLLGWFVYRAYIVLPALAAIFWAIWARNAYIVVGYVACIPWMLLQLFAYGDMPATLSAYYAYPFLIASFWPLLGASIADPQKMQTGQTTSRAPLLLFCGMTACSFTALPMQVNPGALSLPADFFASPAFATETATERALAALRRERPALGTVLVDDSVLALAPNDFREAETLQPEKPAAPNTVLYLRQGYGADRVRRAAAAAGLTRYYTFRDTAICLGTDRPLTAAPGEILPLLQSAASAC